MSIVENFERSVKNSPNYGLNNYHFAKRFNMIVAILLENNSLILRLKMRYFTRMRLKYSNIKQFLLQVFTKENYIRVATKLLCKLTLQQNINNFNG